MRNTHLRASTRPAILRHGLGRVVPGTLAGLALTLSAGLVPGTVQAAHAAPLTDDEIAAIATQAGASNSSSCITGETYTKFVTSMTPKTPVAPGSSGIGTPTIAINGQVISNSTLPQPAQLATLFQ